MKQSIPNKVIEYCSFEFFGMSDSGKTERWIVNHIDESEELGEIEWNGKWRQYWFVTSGYGFTKGCMRTIADFIEELMNKRKEKEK